MGSGKERKVCFIASSGGHWEELMCLKSVAQKYDAFYVTEEGGQANDASATILISLCVEVCKLILDVARTQQIQRLRTEKDQIFQPVKKDTDNLQAVMDTVREAGDVMHLSQNVVETFIDRIEVFNDERVKIHFTFEDVLADHAE